MRLAGGRRSLFALALVAGPLAFGGCGGAEQAQRAPVQQVASPIVHLAGSGPVHIAVIVMENEEYGDIIGSSATPYINRLARRFGLATQMYAIAHPSLPNYLALVTGSTQRITSDCTSCEVRGRGLADQLQARGIPWRAYMEGLPHPCFTGAGAGDYAKKHDPFAYQRSIVGDPGACQRIVPLDRLAADERSGRLPTFVWITPNLCHDMHDCSPATGDHFLAGLVPQLLAALGRRAVLFLTWDEGSTDNGCCRLAAGGHVVTIVAGGGVRPGARLSTPVDHYSTLQTIEDVLGLPRLRGAACNCTPSLGGLLRP
jgi:phosphatidylinositol-3-phosphatase